MPAGLFVLLLITNQCSLWEYRPCVPGVAKHANMICDVVQEIMFHKVDIWLVNMMLCNLWLDVHIIIIHTMTICSHRKTGPRGVTLPFLLFVESKLQFEGFLHILCRFSGLHLTDTILVTTKLFQIDLPSLNHRFRFVLVPCRVMKIRWVLDSQWSFS
jgi:hypothetical protein